ncbi:LacI family DNA-binding transcriptional regulator [soil metagenome]
MASRSKNLTIHDIAALAGVSAGTVSRTINKQPGVGSAARARIEQIINEQGYRVDTTARQLSTGRSQTLGIVFPLQVSEVVLHPVYPELLGALSDAATDAGYDIMLFTVSSPDKVGHVLESVERKRVDGVILPAAGPRDPLMKKLVDDDVPAVLIGHRSRAANLGWVDSTHDIAARDLTRMLIAQGRRRLVMINGPKHISACRMRSTGFWAAVKEAGENVDSAEEVEGELNPSSGYSTAMELLARPERPDGFVCAADSVASGAIDAARELGIDVPGQLSITGFDDSAFAIHTNPQLTTVRMPLREIGTAAVELLIAMIEKRDIANRHVVVDNELVLRGSTSS